jgi:fumarate reductase subunit D
MRYIHGTDEKRRDLLWVWAHRGAGIFLTAVFCALLFIVVLVLRFIVIEKQCSRSEAAALVCGVIALLLLCIGIFDAVWRNARYKLSEKGILVVYMFKTVEIPWEKVKSVSVHPVDVFRSPSAKDYIIVQLSDSPPEAERHGFRLNLSLCRIQRKKFLAIRWTEARMREFAMYHRSDAFPESKSVSPALHQIGESSSVSFPCCPVDFPGRPCYHNR